MSTSLARTWLQACRQSLGLGWWAGALEGAGLAATVALSPSLSESLRLLLCCLLAGGLLGLGLGLVVGPLVAVLARNRDELLPGILVFSLVTLGLGAFWFWPVALHLLRTDRLVSGLAALAVPLGFAATAYYNARYWLRKVEQGWKPRLGWGSFSFVTALAITLLSALGLTWRPSSGSSVGARPNVVLVTIDTLRRDFVSIYSEPEAVPTPRFDAFARSGVLFEDATTPMPETGPAHASIMTGLHPVRHAVLSNGDSLARGYVTIAETLARQGWKTGAFVSSFAVDSRTGLDQGFQIYDDDFFPWIPGLAEINLAGLGLRFLMRFGDPTDFPFLLERGAETTNEHAIRWMRNQGSDPFFLWVHYFEPHAPYEPHSELGPQPGIDHRDILAHEADITYDPALEADLRALYGGEATWVDQQLGVLLDAIDDQELTDHTLVIVTADHGEMLGEHEIHFNHHGLYDEAVRIPLAIRAPGVAAGTHKVAAQVRLQDLVATILTWVNLPPDSPTEGTELLGFGAGLHDQSLTATLMGRTTASLEQGTLMGLRTGHTVADQGNAIKFIHDLDSGTSLLFDLEKDKDEAANLAPTQQAVVARSLEIVQQEAANIHRREKRIDPSTREALKALGYLED